MRIDPELLIFLIVMVIAFISWISNLLKEMRAKSQQNQGGSELTPEQRRSREELAERRRLELQELAAKRREAMREGRPVEERGVRREPINITADQARQRDSDREAYAERAEQLRRERDRNREQVAQQREAERVAVERARQTRQDEAQADKVRLREQSAQAGKSPPLRRSSPQAGQRPASQTAGRPSSGTRPVRQQAPVRATRDHAAAALALQRQLEQSKITEVAAVNAYDPVVRTPSRDSRGDAMPSLRETLGHRASLRQAFVLRELLDKPVSLRNESSDPWA